MLNWCPTNPVTLSYTHTFFWDHCLLECDVVQSGRYVLLFPRNLLLVSSGYTTKQCVEGADMDRKKGNAVSLWNFCFTCCKHNLSTVCGWIEDFFLLIIWNVEGRGHLIVAHKVQHILWRGQGFLYLLWLGESRICHSCYMNYTCYFVLLEVTLLILNCKYAENTSNCTAAWKFIVTDQNVQCWRKQKEL
jgi:hypothetical protein